MFILKGDVLQESKGIRRWSINLFTSPINTFVDYNQWLERFDTQLNEPTNQNSLLVPKVVRPTNKKLYSKTLGTSVLDIVKLLKHFLYLQNIFVLVKNNFRPIYFLVYSSDCFSLFYCSPCVRCQGRNYYTTI